MWIKFCGLVRPEDFARGVALGVNAIGIIAAPGTPRCVSLTEANTLARVPRGSSLLTLVFQNAEIEYANELIAATLPDLLQFHGNESPEETEQFNLPYVKAIRSTEHEVIMNLSEHYNAFGWLVDSQDMDGVAPMLRDLRAAHPTGRLILAGGLRHENVRNRIQQSSPWGVDVSRGIEQMPREKDHKLMERFVHAAQA